jgi:hypothetical protein
MTNADIVLTELKKGKYLTQPDIRGLCNINNGGMPIYYLRKQGYKINDLWVKAKSGKRYVKYYMPEKVRVF